MQLWGPVEADTHRQLATQKPPRAGEGRQTLGLPFFIALQVEPHVGVAQVRRKQDVGHLNPLDAGVFQLVSDDLAEFFPNGFPDSF